MTHTIPELEAMLADFVKNPQKIMYASCDMARQLLAVMRENEALNKLREHIKLVADNTDPTTALALEAAIMMSYLQEAPDGRAD